MIPNSAPNGDLDDIDFINGDRGFLHLDILPTFVPGALSQQGSLNLATNSFEFLYKSYNFLKDTLFFGEVLRIKWTHFGEQRV